MTEFIIRLTPEQEQFLRDWDRAQAFPGDVATELALFNNDAKLCRDVRRQLISAIELYDQLVAEAKAKSDD